MAEEERSKRSITVDGYDVLAERRGAIETSPWGESAYQKHFVWPGVRPLFPPLEGKRVLDAGCGVGDHVGWFLERTDDVVGVDASAESIATARARFGDDAAFHRADLAEPLEFASDGSFDLVVCNLVLDHIEDWRPVFEEFERVLVPDGPLVFTTIHPMRRYRRHRDELTSYHETEAYVAEWGETDARIAHYHRPMSEVFNSLAETGFRVEELREITPREEYEEHHPERYERALEEPDTLCVRAHPIGPGR